MLHGIPTYAGTVGVGELALLLDRGDVLVLTGAGVSTDSGIPDYRGPASVPRTPMTFQDFVATPEARQRYWARAFVGWSRMWIAEPNTTHRLLADLITQQIHDQTALLIVDVLLVLDAQQGHLLQPLHPARTQVTVQLVLEEATDLVGSVQLLHHHQRRVLRQGFRQQGRASN